MPVDRLQAALAIEFVDRLLALVRQLQPRNQLVMREVQIMREVEAAS